MNEIAQKVPQLESTKAVILKAKGAPWLKEAEVKFTKQYGGSVKDPAMVMWLIGKQAGLDVEEIKASTDGGEGVETTIIELLEKVKTSKGNVESLKDTHGWTYVNGGNFEQADAQAKYNIKACVLASEEGTTSTNKAKIDLVLTDGTGIAKLVAYGDAVNLLVEAKVVPGSIIHLPLVNTQYGTHNFGKEKNTVWWKFALPPFGKVNALEASPQEYFHCLENDVAKEGQPAYLTGFITHVEDHEQEVCTVCNRWVLEKKPADHDKCRQEENFGTEMKTFINGTGTSISGQTYKLSFAKRPKVKIAQDLVEIYGKVIKNGAIDVAFITKAGSTATVAAEPAPVAPKPKTTPKKAAIAPPEPEVAEDEVEEPTEEVEAPAPPVKAAPKIMPKKVVAPPPVEETVEEEVVPVVTMKPKTVAAKPKVAPVATPTEGVEVPDEIESWILTNLKQFGGKQRIFVLARQAAGGGKMESSGDAEADKALMMSYCAQLIADGKLEWTNPLQNEVRSV